MRSYEGQRWPRKEAEKSWNEKRNFRICNRKKRTIEVVGKQTDRARVSAVVNSSQIVRKISDGCLRSGKIKRARCCRSGDRRVEFPLSIRVVN